MLTAYGRAFCLISGASRGFGRGLAIKLADCLTPGSVLFLIARNAHDLTEVKRIVEDKKRDIKVVIKSVDLQTADYDAFKSIIESALDESTAAVNQFDTSIIVHNAATLGNVKKTTLEVEDVKELRSYYEMNLFSPILLNSAFFRVFTSELVKKQVVVGITSSTAVRPFKSWNYYCTGKAAKEMFFKVMSAEFPQIRTLIYSPGPMKTDMMTQARAESVDPELRQHLNNMKEEGKLLEVDYSVDKLLSILEADKFKSGDRIDVSNPFP